MGSGYKSMAVHQSIADMNFGVQAHGILPQLGSGGIGANSTFMEMKTHAAATGTSQATNDILFLKRLLFLKATLDNETTFNNFAVPFEEDKTFHSNYKAPSSTGNRTLSGGRNDTKSDAYEVQSQPQPLAIAIGDNEPMLQIMPPQTAPAGLPKPVAPRTAGNKTRPRGNLMGGNKSTDRSAAQRNSLNLGSKVTTGRAGAAP